MNERILQVGAKAFVRNKTGKILLLKNDWIWPGDTVVRWDIPGGRIDTGEPVIKALKREIKEETGLNVAKIESLLGVQDIIRPERHVVRLTFVVTSDGDVMLNHSDSSDTKHVAFGWFDPRSLDLPDGELDEFAAQLLPELMRQFH